MTAPLYCHQGIPLIDIRALDSPALLDRHIYGSASLPAASWGERALELPPRCTLFSLLHDGSPDCLALLASLEEGNSGQALGQDLCAIYLDEPSFWACVPRELQLSGRWESHTQGRLWRPGPLTALLAERWLAWGLPSASAAILDAGCGQGRNAVYLVQALGTAGVLPRLAVVGVDNRTAMVDKFVRFAARALQGEPPVRVALGGGGFSVRTNAQVLATWEGSSASASASASSAAGEEAGDAARPAQLLPALTVYGVRCDILDFIQPDAGSGSSGLSSGGEGAAALEAQWVPPLDRGVLAAPEGASASSASTSASSEAAQAEAAAAGAAAADASSAKAPPPPHYYDAILFARFKHTEALRACVSRLSPRGGVLAVETFHVSLPSLTRGQKLGEGELAEMILSRGGEGGGEAEARRHWLVRVLHEGIVPAEDGRPLLQSVVWVGPP